MAPKTNPKASHSAILKDIELTGFLSELKVLSTLSKRKWSANHASTYEDFDQNVSREIDIIARFSSSLDWEVGANVSVTAVIDVKKDSKRPWIVFSSPLDLVYLEHLGSQLLYSARNHLSVWHVDQEPLEEPSDIFSDSCLFEDKLFNVPKNFGTAFHEAFKAPNEKSKIYEALLTVCKAAWFEYQKRDAINASMSLEGVEFNPKKETYYDIIVPIVILDGTLYEMTLSKNNRKQLRKKQFIPIHFAYSSPQYVREKFQAIDFYPIIVDASRVKEVFAHLEKWCLSMHLHMNETLKRRAEYFKH